MELGAFGALMDQKERELAALELSYRLSSSRPAVMCSESPMLGFSSRLGEYECAEGECALPGIYRRKRLAVAVLGSLFLLGFAVTMAYKAWP